MSAVSKAFELGKLYWQQADSESYKQNKKSDDTFNQFKALECEHLEQLEASNQRELELLAVIEKQRNLLKVADDLLDFLNPSYLPDDQYRKVFDDFSWDVEAAIFCDPEPSQALREHEAKMLEEASKEFIGDEYRETTYGMVERMLCRMAEERRKK